MRSRTLLVAAGGILFLCGTVTLGAGLAKTTANPQKRQSVPNEEIVPHGLFRLKNNTAWILLGLVRADNSWGMHPSFQAAEGQPSDNPAVPKAGERIRLLSVTRLVILDFAKSREQRFNDSPGSRKLLTRDDSTLIQLPVGSEVEVQKVDFGSSGPGAMKPVWVQVKPVRP